MDLFTGAEQNSSLGAVVSSAHSAELISQRKSVKARASVSPVHVGASLRAVVTERQAFIDVYTLLRIVGVYNVTPVAEAEVPGAVG